MRVASHRCGRAGFTLLETVLALALIGLVATLALPRGSPRDSGTSLRIKAYEVMALLRADRDAARAGGAPVTARVDLIERILRSGASERAVALPPRISVRVSEGLAVRIDGLTAAVDLDEGRS